MTEQEKQKYAEYVKEITPKSNLGMRMIKAFLVGGVICLLGQAIINTAVNMYGLDKEQAGSWCALILVFFECFADGI